MPAPTAPRWSAGRFSSTAARVTTPVNRIQAFDLGGNPVPHFKNQKVPYFLTLPATIDNTYIDLAVEFSGYLYVISADANNVHRLDIYHPTQAGTAPLCTTMNLNAARIALDSGATSIR